MIFHHMLFPMIGSYFGAIRDNLFKRSMLPIYELDRGHVQTRNAKLRRFDPATGFTRDPLCGNRGNPSHLTFRSIKLGHAIRKADYVKPRGDDYLYPAGLSFLLSHPDLFEWDTQNLRLQDGATPRYADFVRSHLSGRVGQGVAFLLMEKHGYSYVEHVPANRHGPHQGRSPDFIFENQNHRVLMESKGSFVTPGRLPDIKGAHRNALVQLSSPAARRIKRIHKSFAVGTFLREVADTHNEPSMVTYVDPVGDFDNQSGESKQNGSVRRSNYAGWLRAMGLLDSSRALQTDRKTVDRDKILWLPTIKIGSDTYAFTANLTGFWPSSKYPARFMSDFWEDLPDSLHFLYHRLLDHGEIALELTGLDLRALNAIEYVLRSDYSGPLLELQEFTEPGLLAETHEESPLIGSVLGDGSFYGFLRISEDLKRPEIGVKKFQL